MATMTQLRLAVKAHAKKMFAENVGACIAVSIIASGLSFLVSSLVNFGNISAEEVLEAENVMVFLPQLLYSMSIALLIGFFISPITVGSYAFYMGAAANAKKKVSDVFVWFGDLKLFGKAIGATIWYTILTVFLLFICLFIPFTIGFIINASTLTDTALFVGGIVFIVLTFVGTIVAEINIYALMPAMYLIAENPTLRIFEAFALCRGMMRGHKWEFFLLHLSFLGWQLLASVTCGLSLLYVNPYMQLSISTYVRQRVVMYAAKHIKFSDTTDANNTNTHEKREI